MKLEANTLLKILRKFKFIASLVMWYNILFEINFTSKQLQNKSLDINGAINCINDTKNFLMKIRNDDEFEKMLTDAENIAEVLGVTPNFEQETVRLRKKKEQFVYEAEDEIITDFKQKFKVDFYFSIIDTAIASVDEKFKHMSTINEKFGFLLNIYELQKITSAELLKKCLTLENYLKHDNSRDIDGTDLSSELQIIARRIPENTSSLDVLSYICKNNLENSVPNVFIALRIFATLPVSVASSERSFSKLKLIKTYTRSTMAQERLTGLAIISIEHEIASTIDIDELIQNFAKAKARKINFS